MWFAAETAGRFAREALSGGDAEVCAIFRRSFYVRRGEHFACIGERSVGRGPLNVLVKDFHSPAMGERVQVALDAAASWRPQPLPPRATASIEPLVEAATGKTPKEGLGGLVVGQHNSLAIHAQPALEAIDAWLAGNALSSDAETLVGLGPGLTPSGDDYLGGMLIALRAYGRPSHADSLWRWLKPRLPALTSGLSAAHIAAAASGEGHEALHEALANLFTNARPWDAILTALEAVGHTSGWDALAGVLAVARKS